MYRMRAVTRFCSPATKIVAHARTTFASRSTGTTRRQQPTDAAALEPVIARRALDLPKDARPATAASKTPHRVPAGVASLRSSFGSRLLAALEL
jgi:hypothetical protein